MAPTLALSLHYNALPDAGDALNTAGIGSFWFHAQARDLAQFLHDYLVEHLDRPSYGVYWNNLALTRPQVSHTVLLELGYMTNPRPAAAGGDPGGGDYGLAAPGWVSPCRGETLDVTRA
jgi:N-acetylmuramoyl-L-alanine amidase